MKDYVKLKKSNQDKLFYLYTPTKSAASRSPYLEPYTKAGLPVLLVNTSIDEVIFRNLGNYEELKFVNIETG